MKTQIKIRVNLAQYPILVFGLKMISYNIVDNYNMPYNGGRAKNLTVQLNKSDVKNFIELCNACGAKIIDRYDYDDSEPARNKRLKELVIATNDLENYLPGIGKEFLETIAIAEQNRRRNFY
jgi:hypothetical protein